MKAGWLITGATGFVGNALCAALAQRGRPVRGAVRANADADADLVAIGDIGPDTDWTAALSGVDCVVHAAARVHMMQDPAPDPLAAFRLVNVEGTLELARQAAAAGVRRLVFLSSIKVNGTATRKGAPFTAGAAVAPDGDYGRSKWEAERGLTTIARRTGLEVVIIRPPLVYGPHVKANFATMMRWVERGVPLPLGRVTENRRSLVSLDNLVDLIITCADHPSAAGETFLVSDGEDLSTAELLKRMARALGRPSRLVSVPVGLLKLAGAFAGKRDVAQRLLGNLQVDIAETCNRLGWQPPIDVDEGLRRAAAALISNRGE